MLVVDHPDAGSRDAEKLALLASAVQPTSRAQNDVPERVRRHRVSGRTCVVRPAVRRWGSRAARATRNRPAGAARQPTAEGRVPGGSSMTFSILAVDRRTGEVGVATASFVLAVGARVPVVVPGSGAAVLQGGTPLGLRSVVRRRLEEGVPPQDLVDRLVAGGLPVDAQVAVVDARGRTASHAGPALEQHVGAAQGDGVCAVANLMEREHVTDAAVEAFTAGLARGSLADALLGALTRADELGGDVRGRMSAALHVGGAGDDEDLRVDRDGAPVEALRALHRTHRAHTVLARTRRVNGSYSVVTDVQEALDLAPDDPVCLGALVLALLRAGRGDEAVDPARRLVRLEPASVRRLLRAAEQGSVDGDATRRLVELVAAGAG